MKFNFNRYLSISLVAISICGYSTTASASDNEYDDLSNHAQTINYDESGAEYELSYFKDKRWNKTSKEGKKKAKKEALFIKEAKRKGRFEGAQKAREEMDQAEKDEE